MAQFKSFSGSPVPLGSSYDGAGVNFALFSANASRVELCIFDESGSKELERYGINENSNGIWHIYLAGAKPGMVIFTDYQTAYVRPDEALLKQLEA